MLRVVLKDILGYTEKKLDAISKSLFATLDDDCNQCVFVKEAWTNNTLQARRRA
jgi:hypothetical protein